MPDLFDIPIPAPHPVTDEDRAALEAAIDVDELRDLALELGNIPSPSRSEQAAGEYVFEWMQREGFSPRSVGATPERQNIIGEYGGGAPGHNLLFTAHLDTESPTYEPALDSAKYRPETLANREWLECWLEDGKMMGYPITNDRGPMSCFMIAAKALRKANITLGGKLYLTACPGEIGPEPIEDRSGVDYLGKDIGAHYLFHHGGVAPDFAIAAEGTDYGLTWQGCGYVVFRIRIFGQGIFTPIFEHPDDIADHPNPIYRLGPIIEALHAWGKAYPEANRYESAGGISIPRTQIDAIKAGTPHAFGTGTEVVAIYLEAGLTPRQKAADLQHELTDLMRGFDLEGFEIEPMVVRHGFEADGEAVMPLVAAVDDATRLTLNAPVERANPVYSSMWRDQNVFNMHRIPAITTGMPRWRPTPEEMASSALIYALTALSVCGRADASTSASGYKPVYGDKPF
jgi:acetylornithine deacetylase/succinyl-diaminopimelate desuccinylase-like protein